MTQAKCSEDQNGLLTQLSRRIVWGFELIPMLCQSMLREV